MSRLSLMHKVFAYITSGQRLLVFDHVDHPEAGTQVPAGTLESGEDPISGAMREALEESGLANLAVVAVLGETTVDMRPWARAEIHHRTFVHLRCEGDTPETWEHWERDPHGKAGQAYLFSLRWVSLAEAERVLGAGHGALIPGLRVSLG